MATKKKIKTVKNQKNHVILVLDKSVSIRDYGLEHHIRNQFSVILGNLAENAEKFGQRTEVTQYQFGQNVTQVYQSKNVTKAKENFVYNASEGATRLIDAVAQAIKDAQNHPDFEDEDTSFLLLVLTDGHENASYTKPSELTNLIRQANLTGRFTITFQVPRGSMSYITQYGISAENVREWEQTERGVESVRDTMNTGFQNYFNSRSMGSRSVSNFYVQPNLVNKTKQIQKLDNVSKDFTLLEVAKEQQIRPFVEGKTGNFYPGCAYYLLTKKETVQPQKEVLLYDKVSKKIYGGDQAREIIGLPKGANAKVEPYLHDKYDIFLQSTSVNRILPRGTKVLVKK